jgi:thiamine biosynthesis lipoprotein
LVQIGVIGGLLLAGLSPTLARAETVVLRGATMGTTYQIKFVADDHAIDRETLHADVERVLAEIDEQMSTYRPDSELSRFNRAPAGKWFPVSEGVAHVAAAAQKISEQSGGAMDVTVGPLVRLWHFGAKNGGVEKAPSPHPLPKGEGEERAPSHRPLPNGDGEFAPPADDAIAAARAKVGYRMLEVREQPPALRKKMDGLEVDLSSIASGYTIDLLAELLMKRGVKNYMVELGGEVRAGGRREDGKPWRVGVERPAAGERELEMAVPIENAAIATAGDYRKFFEYNGRRYSHVIDPATGRPVAQELASVTVVADTCIEAEGWDTPLLVLGPERGYECATKHGIAALFISRKGDEVVKRATPAWEKRFGRER